MDQRKSFSDRLSRIGGPSDRQVPPPAPPRRHRNGGLSYALTFPASLLLGLLAGGLSRYAMFHLVTDSRASSSAFARPSVVAVGGGAQAHAEIILAMVAVFILGQMFRLTRKELVSIQIAGAFLGLGLVYNFAFWAPGLAAHLFSREWVEAAQRVLPENGFAFMGFVVPLLGG